MAPAIKAEQLTKAFRTTRREPGVRGALRSLLAPQWETRTVVEDVSFHVEEGELLALLGPNGAGKSTTIKMLTGILTPTSGRAEVCGLVPHEDREPNSRNIGAVFGQRTQLWWDLPARESFAILRDIFGTSESEYRTRLTELDGLLALSGFWHTRVRHLSLGQRVRCDLAAALLHGPRVLFLDEPTIGMDVVVKEQVRQFLRHEVDRRGRTVLLTTHDMVEVARLAERVVLISEGRVALDGSLDDVRRVFGSHWRVHVTLTSEQAPFSMPGLAVLRRDGAQLVLGPTGPDAPSAREAMRQVIQQCDVWDISIEEGDLEDAMRAAYLRQEHEPGADPAGPSHGAEHA
ncbi:ABC transporter ATP-binding protein [Streptomyces griseus]|uniref:ATP-binding cassette domain-containing protein n=1 Tax=Streptomyces sp. CMC78 TaxID=3231512 RepID=A0AB33KFV8_9ACTN|nr:ATP-binding cassette domain-containing protein [Streptomyces griseus]WTD70007.1 ATP-binding cassette domain-containing protein [Streptomyces griseus]